MLKPQSSAAHRPLVSVVVPAYNAAAYLPAALDSALAQTYQPMEIIVVDDGSRDETPEILARYGRLVHVVRQENGGVAAARNAGMRLASGDYVAFLDADDVWEASKIERQMELFGQQPEYGLVHTRASHIDASGTPLHGSLQLWHSAGATETCTAGLLQQNAIVLSAAMVRRSLVGEEPFTLGIEGCEDWDLWLRLSLLTRFGYVDDPLTRYRIHSFNMSSNQRKMTRSRAGVLERFLRQELPEELRQAAAERLRAVHLDLAHLEYEQGSLSVARVQFFKAREFTSAVAVLRFLVTLVPGDIRPTARYVRSWF